MELVSRIHKFIPKGLMYKLNGICKDRTISDNNRKADLFAEALREYNVPFRELGPGTNRYAVRIDGYVFKIAMDRNGINDNYIEFSMSAELQPYVSKTYECNGLIIVSEYVTVITKEEFKLSEEPIKDILSILSSEYLLGDVGFVLKNYLNWGYRENGSLVILDYGFIYRVTGEEVRCDHVYKNDDVCGAFLEYDENYNNLICPKCKSKYNFADVRRKMDLDYEQKEIEKSKTECYILTSEKCVVDDKTLKVIHSAFDEDEQNNTSENDYGKDENTMVNDKNFELSEEESIQCFNDDVINYSKIMMNSKHVNVTTNDCDDTENNDDIYDETNSYKDDDEDDENKLSGLGSNYYDNSDGIYYESDELTYTVANLFGNMVLYTPERLQDTDVPDGMFKYELRQTDDYEDYVCEVGKKILINFYGTVLCTHPIPDLDSCHAIFVDYTSDFKMTQRDLTLSEFLNHSEALDYIESKNNDSDEDDEFMNDPEEDDFEDDIDEDSDDESEDEDFDDDEEYGEVTISCDDDSEDDIDEDSDDESEDEDFDDDNDTDTSDEEYERELQDGIVTQLSERDDDEDEVLPTPEDTVIPVDDYSTDSDEENIEYSNDEFDEDSEDDSDEDEDSEDDDEDSDEDSEDDSDEDSKEESEDINLEAMYDEMVIRDNAILEEHADDEVDETQEDDSKSYTTWSEPNSIRDELKTMIEEDEEEERVHRSNKNYKNKRRNM